MMRSLIDYTTSENSTVVGKERTDEVSSPTTASSGVTWQEKRIKKYLVCRKINEEILYRNDGKSEDKFKGLVLYNYMRINDEP